MKHKHLLKLTAVLASSAVVAVPTAVAATAGHTARRARTGTRVSLRVEGISRTLVMPRTLRVRAGSFTRAGHRTGNRTALGLLNTATHGRWSGSWSREYKEWEITAIKGERHAFSSKYFWAFYVNGVEATVGASEFHLRRGDRVVYAALPDADYDEQLLQLTVSGRGTLGKALTVHVSAYNAKGRAVALKHATLSYAGRTVRLTGATARLKLTRAGRQTLRVSKHGYVRDERVIVVRR